MKNATFKAQSLLVLIVAVTLFVASPAAFAAVPGISAGAGAAVTFSLTATDAYLNQPDGEAVYSWGYGCASGFSPTFVPAAIPAPSGGCPMMQVPGPTLVVTEGQAVTVTLLNGLPPAAGNTSILFPGFIVATTCPQSATAGAPQQGLLTCEAVPGGTVSYTFTASTPGTHPYYSGTQGDLQIEMGLYGAIVVLPATIPANCTAGYHALNVTAQGAWGESDFRLTNATMGKGAAYDHPGSCYDREYIFQWAEMDSRIHRQAQAQVLATTGCTPGTMGCSLNVQTEPYHPAYFLINGRSMPDLMDPNYASEYPHQPYNGNPHIHPGELLLLRTIGQGRWEHPFHEHANHVRILSREGNLVLSPTAGPCSTATNAGCVTFTSGLSGDGASGPGLAGLLMFNTDTTPGEAFDGIFYYTGRGLNWDPFGHHPANSVSSNAIFPITAISESGTTVTATVTGALPPSLSNTTVVIANVLPNVTPGYNGSFIATLGTTTSIFTYPDAAVTGPPTSFVGATATFPSLPPLPITAVSESLGTVTVTVTGALPTNNATPTVIIAGVGGTGYNGTFTATPVSTTSTFTYTDAAGLAAPTSLASAIVTVNTGATSLNPFPTDPLASLPCTPDVNGLNSSAPTAVNFMEWCQDHLKPVQVSPFGDVPGGGPATFPDPNVFTNGAWYSGTPYFGPDANLRSSTVACDTTPYANCTNLNPANVQANPANERGWAFMWHSHNEREITTNNVFPGGMLMMLLVDSREFVIDESQ